MLNKTKMQAGFEMLPVLRLKDRGEMGSSSSIGTEGKMDVGLRIPP